MEEGAVPSIEELKKLKVVELKARLSSLGLHTSGRGIKQYNPFPNVNFVHMWAFLAARKLNHEL